MEEIPGEARAKSSPQLCGCLGVAKSTKGDEDVMALDL